MNPSGHTRCRTARRPIRGVTLIESLITLAIAAVVLGTAAPSFETARARRQLDAVAAQIETDIQHARSLAVAHGATVRLGFVRDGRGSCHVVHTGSAGDCRCDTVTGAPVAVAGAAPLQSARTALDVDANVASLGFDGVRGTVTPTATIRVRSGAGAIHQVVNIMGRVRSCSPAPVLPGHVAC